MKTEFRKAILPDEVKRLVAFDHKVFPKADWFTKSDWERYDSYWMIVDDATVGCCGFEHHVDFQDGQENENPSLRGSLYISTTGILPRRVSARKCVSRFSSEANLRGVASPK